MKNKKILFIVLTLIIGIMAMIYCQKYSFCYPLLAKDVIPVYATVSDAMTGSEPHIIEEIFPQQSVPVLRVVDVKHYFVLEVRLPDGRNGFVLAGNYILLKDQRPRNSLSCLTYLLRNCI